MVLRQNFDLIIFVGQWFEVRVFDGLFLLQNFLESFWGRVALLGLMVGNPSHK